MLQRLGNVIYWTASGIAVLSVLIGVSPPHSDWVIPIVFCVIGGLIWLAGRAARYVLAG